MDQCLQLIIGILILLWLATYIRGTSEGYDYKVYAQSADSMIPKYKYRMPNWEYPYEQAYTANNFPLANSGAPTEQENAPYGACFTEGKLWTCSL
jgi:hypothetical protein